MPSSAIKFDSTVYLLDGLRWFEYNSDYNDLTLFYADGNQETIRHRNARKVYHDLLNRYSIIDVNSTDYVQ
jgi:hypothetical protein